MDTVISSSDVARNFGDIFARASRGETFRVTQYGRPYCVISPPAPEAPAKKAAPARKRAPRQTPKT